MTAKTIRVYLKHMPTVEVFVKTTEANAKTKLGGIKRDIRQQKFPRWAPFKDQPEYTGATITEGWTWEFVA